MASRGFGVMPCGLAKETTAPSGNDGSIIAARPNSPPISHKTCRLEARAVKGHLPVGCTCLRTSYHARRKGLERRALGGSTKTTRENLFGEINARGKCFFVAMALKIRKLECLEQSVNSFYSLRT